MKKYLMTVMAAVALGGLFTGCSNDADLSDGNNSAEFNIVQNYEKAFVTRFGQPHENQTWGFGEVVAGTRSGNTSGDYTAYPATHTYKDASGNVIAGANMNHNEWADPDKYYGGWVVPDPLTEGQKLRVQKYFQANPNLSYQDPHYANFFIQQVYTGGTDAPETGNKESTAAANGTVHAGSTLNQLTVGQACSHINDFNAGTCTTSSVLDNGSSVNNGTYHNDEITLMVNVDDTQCFGYHETGGSNVKGVINHNDKMALVSAAVIDAWAAQNGNPGEAVVDKWNRSFMGFDYELLPEEDIIPENPTYAKFTDVPNNNNIFYAWDGTNVMVIGSVPEATESEEVDITATFALNPSAPSSINGSYDSNGNIVCEFTGQYDNRVTFTQDASNWCSYDKLVIEFAEASPLNATITCNNGDGQIKVGDTEVEVATPSWSSFNGPTLYNSGIGVGTDPLSLTIKSVKLVKEASAPDTSGKYYDPNGYLLGDNNKVMFYSSENTNMYGGIIINLSEDEMKITKDGKTCLNLVKFKELADGGYHPISTDLKKWVKWQAACDGYYSDWIVTLTKAERIDTPPTPPDTPEGFVCRIIAEDLTIGENSDFDFNDVVFDVYSDGKILVRACGGTLPLTVAGVEVHGLFGKSTGTMINTGWDGVAIDYENTYREINYGSAIPNKDAANNIPVKVTKSSGQITLTAKKAKVASKVAVGSDYKWCSEREDIDKKFRKKDGTKLFHEYVVGHLGDDWESGTAWYQYRGK